MDYHMFEEALVDFFCRQEHDVAVARSRAAAIVHIARRCDEEIVGGDGSLVLDCSPLQIVPLIEVEEGDVALDTLAKFNRERLLVDMDSPEHRGGSWLRKPKK